MVTIPIGTAEKEWRSIQTLLLVTGRGARRVGNRRGGQRAWRQWHRHQLLTHFANLELQRALAWKDVLVLFLKFSSFRS